MIDMHENELEINESLVYRLLKNQCPHWSEMPLKVIKSSGTDNALFHLGEEYVIRLPRIDWAAESINREYEWAPRIARCLKTPVSTPLFKGTPDRSYPWCWTIHKWNPGHNPGFENENEYTLLAMDLAQFLNDLHGIKLANGPASRRGISLKKVDAETRKSIAALEGEIDTQSITSLWDELSHTPSWNNDPVWVHGDFLPGNILVQDNRLSAVIDFSDVGIGDPACDLIIAWSLFNMRSRVVFREALKDIDDNTWKRGRGWALSIALIMLPYYKNTNPVLAALARRMLKNVTA